jgi:deoxycytidylate deaminase
VPKAGGGTYWCDEGFDDRDFVRGGDTNDYRKREIFGEIVRLIAPAENPTNLLRQKEVRESQLMDALEYGRVVHAEMSALTDAARCGRSVRGGVLFCTTFPCHICAKHIVAAGIDRVVFLEPYPKSLASDLHSDSIQVEGGDRGHYNDFPAVKFEHFYGVSPRRYREIFERLKGRKDRTGVLIEYAGGNAQPIIDIKVPFYQLLERYLSKSIQSLKRGH